ncbi:hypothetical protein LEP1GSC013_2573 [Leptospira interrogans serovar Valbuzzi str. Duyster]|nr:hypothetical protein LEP1GSC013_2573 [Leptospira interrogans serovar Valbuzzi str. Duyster]ENO72138.1 hypothetical protein LEP1GSC012_2239 [Leptospira interrogans serovar Valbuzzi str. Valbuzzi]
MNFYFRVLFQFKKLKLFYTILNNVSSTVKNLGESDCHRQPGPGSPLWSSYCEIPKSDSIFIKNQ